MEKQIIIRWAAHSLTVSGPDWAQTWVPNTDICERDDSVVVRVEVAGVPAESLEILVEEDALVIRGVRENPAIDETAAGYRFRQLEIEYGPFQRVIPLPFAVNADRAEARLRNGILEVKLPRTLASGQTIDVVVEED